MRYFLIKCLEIFNNFNGSKWIEKETETYAIRYFKDEGFCGDWHGNLKLCKKCGNEIQTVCDVQLANIFIETDIEIVIDCLLKRSGRKFKEIRNIELTEKIERIIFPDLLKQLIEDAENIENLLGEKNG